MEQKMIFNAVKGNIEEPVYKDYPIDYVNIHWYDSGKRIHKLKTYEGTEIGIRLDSDNVSRGLLQGDILEIKEGKVIAINILEETCITIKADELRTVAKVCYEIGNRHSPLFYSEDYSELVLPYDKPILEMLNKMGVVVGVKKMKIHRDRSISSVNNNHYHSHDDGHTHTHHHGHHEGDVHEH